VTTDYRDHVIAEFAASEAALLERVALLEAEVASYRLVAVTGIHYAQGLSVEIERLRSQHHRLLDEYREVRLSPMARGMRACA
jgi:hypothetical protein